MTQENQATITRVDYEFCSNLGNYENEKIRVQAEVPAGGNWKEVLSVLKNLVLSQTVNEKEYWEREKELLQMKNQLSSWANARKLMIADWQRMTEFMKAQGIKTDFPKPPDIPEEVVNLALSVFSTTTSNDIKCLEVEILDSASGNNGVF